MMKASCFLTMALLSHAVAGATDIDLSVEVLGGGGNAVTAVPGAVVQYQVVGILSDGLNEGLASILFDMHFEGGPLQKGNEPAVAPMSNFARPLGMTNPIGFGGTEVNGDLIQVGGAQNTTNYSFPGIPTGATLTQVAKPPSTAVVLFTGSVTMPNEVGTFELEVLNVDANVIQQGQTGVPVYAVERAPLGNLTNLTIDVKALTANIAQISIAAPVPQVLQLDAGTINAGRGYWVLGSFTGTSPGLALGTGDVLPLNFDLYMNHLIGNLNPPILANNFASLDGQGRNQTLFNLPHVSAALVGVTVHHAYVLFPLDFTSNAVSVTLVP